MSEDGRVRDAVGEALAELGGTAGASALAKKAAETLAGQGESVTYRDVKSDIWRLVDRQEFVWTPDGKIRRSGGRSKVTV